MSGEREIREEIEQVRGELAATVAELSERLDVKARGRQGIHDRWQQAVHRYERAKADAPPEVRRLVEATEHRAEPVIARVNADRRRAALIAGAAVGALLVLRRLRRSRAG